MLTLQYDAVGRSWPVGAGEVRYTQSGAEEAEGDQECYQDLRTEVMKAEI